MSYVIYRISGDGVLRVIAGNGRVGQPVAGAIATATPLDGLYGMDLDPQGVVHFNAAGTLWKIDGENRIRKVLDSRDVPAELWSRGFGFAQIRISRSGAIYFKNNAPATSSIIRFSAPNHFEVIAGGGTILNPPEGTRGVDAKFEQIEQFTIAADETVAFHDARAARIRQVGHDGRLVSLVSAGSGQYSPDGTPAPQATGNPQAVEFGPNGLLYYADMARGISLRRINADGRLETIFSQQGLVNAGVPIDFQGKWISSFRTADAQNFVVGDTGNFRLYSLNRGGGSRPIAGNGCFQPTPHQSCPN